MCGLIAQIPTAEIPLTQTTGICCPSEAASPWRYESRRSLAVLPGKKRRTGETLLDPLFPDDSLDLNYGEYQEAMSINHSGYMSVVRHSTGGVQRVA